MKVQRSLEDGAQIRPLYRKAEAVDVNIEKAVYRFEIIAKFKEDEGHWNLAFTYPSVDAFVGENRCIHHYLFVADLGNRKAGGIVGEYSGSLPGHEIEFHAAGNPTVSSQDSKELFTKQQKRTGSKLCFSSPRPGRAIISLQ